MAVNDVGVTAAVMTHFDDTEGDVTLWVDEPHAAAQVAVRHSVDSNRNRGIFAVMWPTAPIGCESAGYLYKKCSFVLSHDRADGWIARARSDAESDARRHSSRWRVIDVVDRSASAARTMKRFGAAPTN